jgi:hypothetical protein
MRSFRRAVEEMREEEMRGQAFIRGDRAASCRRQRRLVRRRKRNHRDAAGDIEARTCLKAHRL